MHKGIAKTNNCIKVVVRKRFGEVKHVHFPEFRVYPGFPFSEGKLQHLLVQINAVYFFINAGQLKSEVPGSTTYIQYCMGTFVKMFLHKCALYWFWRKYLIVKTGY